MTPTRRLLTLGTLAVSLVSPTLALADDDRSEHGHAVFVMTNDADANAVLAYERSAYGTLGEARRYATGGRGSGGKVDPLTSQGSLTLSADHEWLLAVNAGSGTLSVFRVRGAALELTDRAPTGGSEPNAVAQHGELVYVLDTAGSSSVVGFRLRGGHLERIAGSQRFLSGNGVVSTSLAFSPDGRFLLVTERGTNRIDGFAVQDDGRLAPFVATASAGAGLFALSFAPGGTAIASETGPGGPNSSTISSYVVQPNGSLSVVSAALPTLGAANCWNAVTPDGRFVYASNAGSASISGFSIAANGALTPVPGTVLGFNPAGSANLDIAVSADGKFLYSLNGASGAIGVFAIRASDGSLTNLGTRTGLPAAAGLNGIAAN
jgi:6-phosphogluconolactonase (cycloisomerase 2 family)